MADGTVCIDGLERADVSVDAPAIWEYEDQGDWRPYDVDQQPVIEKQYKKDPNSSVPVRVFGVGLIMLHFKTMTQRVMTDRGGQRNIRRRQDVQGAKITPREVSLIHLSVNTPAQVICVFVNGLLSSKHVLPDVPLDGPFSIHPDHPLFLFGSSKKDEMGGGSVEWVSLQPTPVTGFEVSQVWEQYGAWMDWECPVCTIRNPYAEELCKVCGTGTREMAKKAAASAGASGGPPKAQVPEKWSCDCGFNENPATATTCGFCCLPRGTKLF